MSFLLIKGGHHPSGLHLKPGSLRFMGFSGRFIFALMPLCSAVYWCFCHIVKIYGAISLSWNGLIEVSGLIDLWHNMTGGGKGKKRTTVSSWNNIFILIDLAPCHFTRLAKEITTSAVCVKYIPDIPDKIIPQFSRCLWWAFPTSIGVDNFLWHLSSSIAHDYTRKHSEGWLIPGRRRRSFWTALCKSSQLLHSDMSHLLWPANRFGQVSECATLDDSNVSSRDYGNYRTTVQFHFLQLANLLRINDAVEL